MLQLTQQFITNNRTFSSPIRQTVRGLMLHSVGVGQPNASVFIRSWDSSAAGTSVHAVIERGGRVFQTLPWNFRAWHAGGSANNTHIGVELTEPASIRYTTGANFVDSDPNATRAHVLDTYQTAVALFADLCLIHGLDALSDGVIVSHSEGQRRGIASNHADVEHLWGRFGLTMAQFRRDVAALAGQGGSTSGTAIQTTLLRVTTNTVPLNCRAVPSLTAPVLGTFPRGALLTATRRSGDWFYVTNGTLSGWSSADFLTDATTLAIDKLVTAGVINSPRYWQENFRKVQHLDRLLINLSELTYRNTGTMEQVDTAIEALHQAGAINTPSFWQARYAELDFLDVLLKRAAGML